MMAAEELGMNFLKSKFQIRDNELNINNNVTWMTVIL